MSSLPDDQTVKDHIARLRIKELSECLDRLGMKKQGRKEDLQRRLLTVIDDAGSLWNAGLQSHGMPQVEATKRVIEEVYARYMVQKASPALRLPPTRTEATSAPTATANGGNSATSSRLPQPHSNPPGAPARWPASNTGPRPHHPNALGFQPVQPTSHTPGAGPSASSSCAPQAQAGTSAGVHGAAAPVAPGGTVRCICEQPATRHGELLSCSNCHVYQHARCVTKPETRASAPPHMCERCRAERIDPYWEVVTSDIMPAFKLMPTGRNTYVGTKLEPVQNAERMFTITPSQYELFKKRPNHKLQVVCMQLSDSVPYRCLWPLASELRVNGLLLHVYNRGAHTKPGKNQRDEPANIGVLANPSRNRITMSCSDPASYVLLLQIVRRRSTEEVKGLIRPPLPLPEAIERVKREIKSSDEDIEVDHAVVSLKCPLTGARVKTPARFSEIEGLMFFDLDAFLSVAERSRKWQCPNSMRNSSVYTLQVDAFMSSILGSLQDLPDVAEVQVSPQGQWRPVGGPGVRGSNSSWPWCDAGVAPSALQLPAGQASSAAQMQLPAIKQDPEGSSRPCGGDSSDEEDEHAELQKAAQAMQAQQRKAKQAASELIVISDSSEDEAPPPPPKRPRPAASPSSSAAPAPAPPPRSIPPSGAIRIRVNPPASMLACPPPPSSAPQGQPPLPPNPPRPLPAHPPGGSAPLAAHSHLHRPSPPTPMELIQAAAAVAVPPPPAPSTSGTLAHARAPALPAAQALPPAPPLPSSSATLSSGAAAGAIPTPLPPTSVAGTHTRIPQINGGSSQVPPLQGGWGAGMDGGVTSNSAGMDGRGAGGGGSSGAPQPMISLEHMQLATLEHMQQQLLQQLQQQQQLQASQQQPNQAAMALQVQLLQVQQQLQRLQQLMQQQSQSQSQSLPFCSSPLVFPSLSMHGLQLPIYPPLQLNSQPHPAALHNHLQPPSSQPALPPGNLSHHQSKPPHVPGNVSHPPAHASHIPVHPSLGPTAGAAAPLGGWGAFRPASAHPSLHVPQPPSPPSPPAALLAQLPSSSPSPRAPQPPPPQQQQQARRRQAASAPQSEIIVIDDDDSD